MEMIKGIQGHGYRDELVVPIIENTPHEGELTESLAEAVCSSFIFSICRGVLSIKISHTALRKSQNDILA